MTTKTTPEGAALLEELHDAIDDALSGADNAGCEYSAQAQRLLNRAVDLMVDIRDLLDAIDVRDLTEAENEDVRRAAL